LTASDEAFDGLKKLGLIARIDSKTSLKMKRTRSGVHLANEYDNILTDAPDVCAAGINDFTQAFSDFSEARKVSDHIPVFIRFNQ
ncbi:MAG: endonuclease, partial [SAR324 cluster bacterium]|nr:endonuclease [SAR324 cluster bacterium]